MSKQNTQTSSKPPLSKFPPSKLPPSKAAAANEPAKVMAWHEAYALQLDSQLTLLTKLDSLSQQQREMISLEDPEPLLQLVQERQVIVDELVEIDAKTQEARAKVLGDGPSTLERSVRDGLRFKLEQVAARAKAVMQRDAKDQELLQTRRKRLSEELSELAGAKRAVAAYEQSGGAGKGPVFQDQEG